MYTLCKEIKSEQQEMREVFAEVMDELASLDKRVIYLDADIMNSIKMVDFGKKHPEQTVNCGIQEANMIGCAAGMSASGLIPFTHTFAPFASRRVMDQVFVSAALAKQNIRIIGSDPGVTAAANGGTHIPLEDIGMMRCIPEITIIEPTDSILLSDMLRQTKDLYGVFYIRLSRKKAEQIYTKDSTFTIGKANTLRDGNDITIISSGICVGDACRVSDKLKQEGIQVRVLDMFTIKPIDKEAIIKAAKETGAIVTVENHNIINGLGSAVSEVLSENAPVFMKRLGAPDTFAEVGTPSYLKEIFNMTENDIEQAVKELLQKKTSIQ